ncbi:MAG: hypothetical protein FJX53_09145 [Alphaproteobacteria bacterium]|nr:hypothetical protein [Alphaproteobacteria bacterium]
MELAGALSRHLVAVAALRGRVVAGDDAALAGLVGEAMRSGRIGRALTPAEVGLLVAYGARADS